MVIPAYNAEKWIEEAITSVIRQTFDDWELIIVNDSSTDATVAVCERFTADSRVRLEHLDTNHGQIGAHNRGVQMASSPWVKILHADDRLLPRCLELFVSETTVDPDLVAIGCNGNIIDEFGAQIATFTGIDEDRVWPADEFLLVNLLGRNVMWAPTFYAFRRDAFIAAGLYDSPDSSLRHRDWGFDWHIMWKLAAYGKARSIAQPLVEYRKHSAQISTGFFEQAEAHMRYYWLARFFSKYPLRPPVLRQVYAAHTAMVLFMALHRLRQGNEAMASWLLGEIFRSDQWLLTYEEGLVFADLERLRSLVAHHRANWSITSLKSCESISVKLAIETGHPINVVAVEKLLSKNCLLIGSSLFVEQISPLLSGTNVVAVANESALVVDLAQKGQDTYQFVIPAIQDQLLSIDMAVSNLARGQNVIPLII